AVRKQQVYNSDIPEGMIVVRGDFRQLSQVVSNLVGNAIKYTPEEGTVTVRLLVRDKSVRFEVQDTGYGIAKDAQEKLFTEFYRVQTDQTRSIKGTGLGLSLVKSVVDAHRGTVGVESEEGKGSLFFVELPRKLDES
ncbi:MAG: sensor histidine kinase, partial [Aggregatilineales bacterium]